MEVMTIAKIHSAVFYDAFCEICSWSKGQSLSPPFRSVRRHVADTRHKVLVRRTEGWEYGTVEV